MFNFTYDYGEGERVPGEARQFFGAHACSVEGNTRDEKERNARDESGSQSSSTSSSFVSRTQPFRKHGCQTSYPKGLTEPSDEPFRSQICRGRDNCRCRRGSGGVEQERNGRG